MYCGLYWFDLFKELFLVEQRSSRLLSIRARCQPPEGLTEVIPLALPYSTLEIVEVFSTRARIICAVFYHLNDLNARNLVFLERDPWMGRHVASCWSVAHLNIKSKSILVLVEASTLVELLFG
jgi:hypothetical protein